MPPASADDLPYQIRANLELLEVEIDSTRRDRADNAAYLEEKASRGLDEQTKGLFEQASRSPQAPESLRKVAAEVHAGRMSWDDVFSGRGGPLGAAFLTDAFETARAHFEDDEVTPVPVPQEALDLGVDPDAIAAEVAQVQVEATAAHDALWQRDLGL